MEHNIGECADDTIYIEVAKKYNTLIRKQKLKRVLYKKI